MKDSFYSSFENLHRGSTDSIKKRLNVYVSFITPLLTIYPNAAAIDLGCGRGEWLSLVQELGFDARGVDLDEGMLSYCHDLKLNVENRDIISYLKDIPDESVVLVSAFHVVEHIGFDNVKELVMEAHRVLKPGGLLILETPNAENFVVGTNNFYLDPTHDKPIPNQLLIFLTEYTGFVRNKLLRLQENKDLHTAKNITLSAVLNGVSPDYSVIAQKETDNSILNKFAPIFEREFGLSVDMLADKYENMINERFEALHRSILKLDKNTSTRQRVALSFEGMKAKYKDKKIMAPIRWIKNKFR